jgi:hypothetical protein
MNQLDQEYLRTVLLGHPEAGAGDLHDVDRLAQRLDGARV